MNSDLTEYSFKDFLQAELSKRIEKNVQYSLRSFATALGVSGGYLSQVLNAKKPITSKFIKNCSLKLGLNPQNTNFFLNVYAGKEALRYEQVLLQEDQFQMISDWYHYAILEITKLDNFKPDFVWVSKKLNISINQVKDAVSRLKRLGFLRVSKSSWVNTSGNNTNIVSNKDLESSAKKKLQKQILEQAIKAMDNIPIEIRNQTSMTMSINKENLESAIKLITRFRRELCCFLEQGEQKQEVYQLSISLFPVTNNLKKQREN